MSRFGGYGGPHSANGGHFHHQGPPPSAPYAGMYDRFERGFDGRHGGGGGGGFYGDYYSSCFPGGPTAYSGGPGRYEPYGAPPGRLGGIDRRPVGGVRPKPSGSGGGGGGVSKAGNNSLNKSGGASNAKKAGGGGGGGGGRRPSGKRTSAVQFTASRSRLKPPFVISQSKWGNSNRSSWIFPRFGDYIDTDDTPIWLTPDDLVTKFEVPPDNQYCPDCGVLIINLKRHKTSDIHRETLEGKRGEVAKWKLEFMERKRKYEERKAQGGSRSGDNLDDKDEADEDGNGVEDDDEEEEPGEEPVGNDDQLQASCQEENADESSSTPGSGSGSGSDALTGGGGGGDPGNDQGDDENNDNQTVEDMETADVSPAVASSISSPGVRSASPGIDVSCNGETAMSVTAAAEGSEVTDTPAAAAAATTTTNTTTTSTEAAAAPAVAATKIATSAPSNNTCVDGSPQKH